MWPISAIRCLSLRKLVVALAYRISDRLGGQYSTQWTVRAPPLPLPVLLHLVASFVLLSSPFELCALGLHPLLQSRQADVAPDVHSLVGGIDAGYVCFGLCLFGGVDEVVPHGVILGG